jgi:hypothetical protein
LGSFPLSSHHLLLFEIHTFKPSIMKESRNIAASMPALV